MGASLLDFKLGLRMLVRHPGLTVVGGLAMAFVIAVGAGTVEFLRDTMFPSLPVPGGDRVVRLYVADPQAGARTGVDPVDLVRWKEELGTVASLGGFHATQLVLEFGEGAALPVDAVAVSPEAFEIAPTLPVLGRPLGAGDEDPRAPRVVVVSHGLWRSAFAADPGIVGREVRLGGERATIVGVASEAFVFPEPADVYVPLGLERLAAAQRSGEPAPRVTGFGRLPPGVTLDAAGAELSALGAGATIPDADRPHLSPVVAPFAHPVMTVSGIAMNTALAVVALVLIGLMVVVSANVALLLFARAATRESEIAVRTALGASRGRIVGQLLVEALVLAGLATCVGLLLASWGLRWALGVMTAGADSFPFWVGSALSPSTVGWAGGLALVGAVVAGVIPGLQVSGRDVHGHLQRGAGRGAGPRLGGLWHGIVILQVALTVAFVPVVTTVGDTAHRVASAQPGMAEEEYLVARLSPEGSAHEFASAYRELTDRLAREPWVRGVALTEGVWPGWDWSRPIEVEGMERPPESIHARRSQHFAVEPGYLDLMGTRLVAGRGLTPEDATDERRVVVVNEAFVERVLQGRNAVGQRIRLGDIGEAANPSLGDEPAGPWHEIVGVVEDRLLNPFVDLPHQGVAFRPLAPARARRPTLTLRVAGEPGAYADRLRVLALQLDGGLRLEAPEPLAHRRATPVREYAAWFRVAGGAGAIALLLTLAGIYAVMSYAVSRRTREIGVRAALGGRPLQVAGSVLSRALRQVAYGVLAGGSAIPLGLVVVSRLVEPGPDLPPVPRMAVLLLAYMGVMMGVCMLACVVPLRRALRVEPTEALGAEG
jgi:predicted permease